MGDEEETFFDGGQADPEPGVGQKFQTAVCSCCLGLFLFPLSLFLLGWNERNFVCTQKQIYYAEENAEEWPCASIAADALPENEMYHFSCPFDASSYSNFSGSRFNTAMDSTDTGLQNLLENFRFTGLGGRQTAQIYTCVETQHERTEGTGENRRRYISYTYSMQWVSTATSFHAGFASSQYLTTARSTCVGVPLNWQGEQPLFPLGVDDGVNARHADSVTAGTIALPDDWIEQIPIVKQITTADLIGTLPAPATSTGWRMMDNGPEAPEATITNCVSLIGPAWGCVKLTYMVSTATVASVIANVGTGKIAGSQITPASWACDEGDYFAFYPETITMTLVQMIEAEHSTNSTTAWIIRVVGLLLAWAAVFCLFSPVTFAADVLGDCLAFIPCVGGLIEDVVEGVVNLVVCCISCSIGCSSGLCVIAIVMLVMRPLVGGLLLLAACCLIGCSFAAASQAPKKGKRAEEEMELVEES